MTPLSFPLKLEVSDRESHTVHEFKTLVGVLGRTKRSKPFRRKGDTNTFGLRNKGETLEKLAFHCQTTIMVRYETGEAGGRDCYRWESTDSWEGKFPANTPESAARQRALSEWRAMSKSVFCPLVVGP